MIGKIKFNEKCQKFYAETMPKKKILQPIWGITKRMREALW